MNARRGFFRLWVVISGLWNSVRMVSVVALPLFAVQGAHAQVPDASLEAVKAHDEKKFVGPFHWIIDACAEPRDGSSIQRSQCDAFSQGVTYATRIVGSLLQSRENGFGCDELDLARELESVARRLKSGEYNRKQLLYSRAGGPLMEDQVGALTRSSILNACLYSTKKVGKRY
jgi:hypothetical protein